ncbi:MAG: hypothetical protein Ct9H90mP18_03160 [Gammaproteobacteria bacterium]|nr:MAG: hypothetical protein Ct9H90mP18_03160 [Gammaproteobacteria bacterium]
MIKDFEVVRALILQQLYFYSYFRGFEQSGILKSWKFVWMLGMSIAIIATLLGPYVTKNYFMIFILMVSGASIGLYLLKKSK